MNRHALHYLDLHPEPVDTREPSPLMIWAGIDGITYFYR